MGASDGDATQPIAAESRTNSYVFLGYIVSILMGILGGIVGAYAGWVWQEGLAPIVMAAIGFVLFFCITCAVSGPGVQLQAKAAARWRSPDPDRVREIGLSSFDLYVTVHKVKDLYRTGGMGALLAAPKYYVEVVVGRLMDGNKFSVQRNPPTATCASADYSFEEGPFHFLVSPTDDTIKFILRQRDVWADSFTEPVLGERSINITDEVLREGFPQRRAYELHRHHVAHEAAAGSVAKDPNHLAGTIVVSFTPGADCKLKVESHGVDRRLAHQHLQSTQGQLLTAASQSGYGTWASGR